MSHPFDPSLYLKNDHKLVSISDIDFRDSQNPTTIVVDNSSYSSLNGSEATIRNCKFNTVIIKSGNWTSLTFHDVTFDSLSFENGNVNTLTFNVVYADLIEIKEVKFIDFICKASVIKELNLNDTSRENSNVTIDNSGILFFDFGGTQKRNHITFIKATIRKLNLHSLAHHLTLKQSTEIQDLSVTKIICEDVRIENSHIHSRLIFDDDQQNISLVFNNGSVQGGIEINCHSGGVHLTEVRLNSSLLIKSKTIMISLSNCPYIDSFTTSTRLGHHNQVNISNVEFGTLKLIEATSNLMLKNVKIKKEISFNETTLTDKAHFDRVYLDECSIKFHDSSITQAKFHTIRWPKNYQIDEIITKEDTDKLSLLWHKREAYRQFKVVSLSFQNKIDARQFLKNEVRMHYRYVKEVLREKFRTTKIKNVLASKEFGDYLILGTNRLLSNFGESLARPLFGLLLSTLIFLLLAILEKDIDLGVKFEYNICNWELDATLKGIGLYLNMLSPVHSTEIVNFYDPKIKYSITGVSDFFMRILAGYFIFYFVRATRKFNFDI